MLNTVTVIDERIIRHDVEGPLNLKQTLNVSDLIHHTSQEISQTQPHWASITVFHTSCRVCEDTEKNLYAIMEQFKAAKTLSAVNAVVIAPNVDGYGEMENMVAELHVNAGNVFCIFENYDAAVTWSRAQLARLDKE